MPNSPVPSALFTDLYQLTMAQAYLDSGTTGQATFSLYFRRFPPSRGYYVFSGLESAIEYLEGLSFSDDDIAAVQRVGDFSYEFLEFLKGIHFTGNVRAMDEGQVFFPHEPVMEVTGPIIECQLLETALVNIVNLESMLTTKAARAVEAARGRQVVDFGARRTHGTEAALKLARSSYIAGFAGTSNVAAAAQFGIPAFGTMAHSFVTAFDSELEAFRAYARSFPDSSTLLVDTYDTVAGVNNAVVVAQELRSEGHELRGVRLDSGDLDALSREARSLLDDAGLEGVAVFASGGLDEYAIDKLVSLGAPIDGFGVGTRVGTSADAPYTDFVYKLVEYDGRPVMKLSADKATLPGAKQVSRLVGEGGTMERDLIHGDSELALSPDYRGLLNPVIRDGRRLHEPPSISEVRSFHGDRVREIPAGLRGLEPEGSYTVDVSDEIRVMARRISSGVVSNES